MESIHNEILELTLAGYWDWNIRDNTQYFSPKFSSMFGYQENELSNSTLSWRQIIFPEDLSTALEFFQNYLKNNSHGSYITEARYKHKDGSEVWVICSGKVIEWDENGNPVRMIGSHTDITKQKKAEIALKISEERFKGAFENSAIGMALVSLEGSFIKVNKEFCKIIGYSENEILSLSFQDITHLDDLEKDLENVYRLLSNEIISYNMEKRYIHQDKSIVWVNLSVSLVKDINSKPLHFVSQIEDITEKKRIEEEVKQKEAILSIVISNIPGSIHQYHYLGRFKSKITFATASIFDIFELTPEEVKENAFKIFERTYEEDKKGLIESFEKSVDELKEWNYEYRVSLPIKGLRWIRVNSKPVKQEDGTIIYYSYATDITEKKNEELSKLWLQVLEGFGDGYWDFDLKTKKSFVSYDWMSKLGYETSEIDYDKAMLMMDESTAIQVTKKIDNLLTGKTDIYINEQKVYKKDGSYLWALLKGKLIKDIFSNEPIKISGTITDITNQKKKEFHLQKTLDIVSEQNKRLLNFAHIVSHNLRNHASNFEMLVNLFEISETQEEKNYILRMLKESSFNLTDTITNLNEVVSIQTQLNQQRSNLNLVEYLNKTFHSLSSEIDLYGITIKNNIDINISISFNSAYFESILLNLVSNSIKYRSNKRQCIISLNLYYQEKYIVLEISDNGRGIDLERHGNKIFGMYKTFHNNPDARGIGLFITKNQIEALGGKIEVYSKLDEGTTFKVFFLNDKDN